MILNSLLKTHGGILTHESLQTLLNEVKVVVDSRPLTTETIICVTSLIPFSPINLLTMKSKILMPPLGRFFLHLQVLQKTLEETSAYLQ